MAVLSGEGQTASLTRAALGRIFDREARRKLNRALATLKLRRSELDRSRLQERARARELCKRSKGRARERGRTLVAAARVEARQLYDQSLARCARERAALERRDQKGRNAIRLEERRLRDEYKRATTKAKEGKQRSTAAERRGESDDEVRRNVEPELVAVFDRVSASIKPTARMDRTEVFLHWVQENPGEVIAIVAEQGEQSWRKETRAIELASRAARRLLKKKTVTPRDLRELAIACPDVEALGFVCDDPGDVVAAWETLERERYGMRDRPSEGVPF